MSGWGVRSVLLGSWHGHQMGMKDCQKGIKRKEILLRGSTGLGVQLVRLWTGWIKGSQARAQGLKVMQSCALDALRAVSCGFS